MNSIKRAFPAAAILFVAILFADQRQVLAQEAAIADQIQEERSVKPGINDNFVNPELDVSEWVSRFEIESREIFAAREAVLSAIDLQPGTKVADVGAGTGLYTREFSRTVGDTGWVYAVDISPRFLEHINAQAHDDGLTNITGVLCSDRSVNLPPASVDVVFVCDTYHHFEYPQSTLKSIHKALKEGGTLIVIDFNRIEGVSREWVMGHVRGGKNDFRGEIEAAGFAFDEDIEIEGLSENYFLRFRRRAE